MTLFAAIIILDISGVRDIDLSHNKLLQLEELKLLVTSYHSLKRLSLGYNRLHSVESLKHLSELCLSELVLEGVEVCSKYKDPDTYFSASTEPGESFPRRKALQAMPTGGSSKRPEICRPLRIDSGNHYIDNDERDRNGGENGGRNGRKDN